jgi:hypothetical protein
VGIHRTDGGYKTRDQIEADMRTSREAVDMEFLYFTGDKENEFLARFDWVINPNGSASKSEGSQTSAIISSPSTYGRISSQRISSFNPKNSTPLQIDLSSFKNAVGTIRIVGRARDLTKALATETNFLYLKSTGELFYNENGISPGFGNGGIFAVLENRPSLLKSNLAFI